MVSAEKNNGDESYGRLSRRRSSRDSSPQQLHHSNSTAAACSSDDSSAADDDAAEDRDDNGMRVGGDYQAVIPNLLSGDDYNPESLSEKALLVWSPSPDIAESKLDDFLTASKEKYGYNAEQALGMLFWHKHDLEKAMCDLPNFTPFPDEWTVEDKVLFEQAFQFHGKCFYRIRQMLPDKSIASLIKYYYSWKKTRSRTSLMDRQARKRARQRGDGLEAGSEEGSNSESEFEGEQKDKDGVSIGTKSTCSNCTASTSQIQSTPKGGLCPTCYHYWRRTGSMKPNGTTTKRPDLKDRHGPSKSKRKPPRGMYLNPEDLRFIALGPPGQGEAILKSLDSEVVSLKRQVQNNKQIISSLKHKSGTGIDELRPSENATRMNSRWTNDELLLAVQGVRKYGKDCKAIAEVIGNKAEAHIKSFFVNYQRRYNLDAILQEFEAENGPVAEEEKDEKMDVDTSSASNSNSGKSTPVAFIQTNASTASGAATVATVTAAVTATTTAVTATTTPTPTPTTNNQTVPPTLTSVPPPLLKPVQSPSIMNRPPSLQPQQAASRFPMTRSVGHQPPPLITSAVHSPHNQQLSSID